MHILLFVDWDDYPELASPPCLLGLPRLSSGSLETIDIPGPGAIRYLRGLAGDPHGGIYGPGGEFAIAFASGVSATLIANWIWEAIKRSPPPTMIKIDKIEVEFEEGAVKTLVIQRIEECTRPDGSEISN